MGGFIGGIVTVLIIVGVIVGVVWYRYKGTFRAIWNAITGREL